VIVAIGGDIPLHCHPVMELQFVLAGHGLALDADGWETPVAPGGAVISPAGPAGAHGFRSTGALPLTLLCVYPSPGGATPGRSPFELGSRYAPGPRTTYTPPQLARTAPADDANAPVARLLDETLDADGGETPIAPGGTVISPAGPAGAHGFRNTGSLPLQLLCVYPAPLGVPPGRQPFTLPG